ncbi:hypothetical protein BDY21DRAFT_352043 [Lineolata rhizophorae]|uniref:CFEM domain-containing protein n=1 Tax=Lineolata rhizophorae TaxID=578093 RepID=A0A6A6NTA4_9PEZI|nr:hypothetical protein BDY21DRAFT_352043 [Lineolata rhizophorae]
MRVTIASTLAFGAALVAAQFGDLPDCAQSCVGDTLAGCPNMSVDCICNNQGLLSDLSCCVSQVCDPEDIQATIDFANDICGTVDVTVPTAASCPGASASQTGSATSSETAAAASTSNAAVHNSGSGMGVGVALAGMLAMI